MRKRITSLFLVLALCLTLLPTAALATENTTEPSTQLTEPTPRPPGAGDPGPRGEHEDPRPAGGTSPGRGTPCGRGGRPGP